MSTARPDDTAEFFDKIAAAIAQVDVRPGGVFEDRGAFEQWMRNEIRQFAASRPPAPQLDPVFGLPEGEPAPAAAPAAEPAPARRRAPRKGDVETAIARQLKTLPDDLAKGALGVNCLKLARDIDQGEVEGKDVAVNVREIRLSLDRLEELRPAGRKDDATDTARQRREGRLASVHVLPAAAE